MEGTAKTNKICRVCGSAIMAGASVVKWNELLPNSERHSECYGKPDVYSNKGMLLGEDEPAPAPKTEGVNWAELMAETAAQEAAKADTKSSDSGDGATAQCAPGDQGQEDTDSAGDKDGKGQGNEKPGEPKDKQNDEGQGQPPPSDEKAEDFFKQIVDAVTPPVAENVGKMLDDPKSNLGEKINKLNKLIDTQGSKAADLGKSVEEAANKVNGLGAALEEAMAKFKAAEAGKLIVELKVKQGDKESTIKGVQHKLTPKLLKLIGKRRNVYLHGPTGSGKSTAARKCAEALGLPYYYISLNPQSSTTRIEGYQTAHGEYVMTTFRKAYTEGGVFCADEVDNSSPNLWTSLNNCIDSDLGSFPDGMAKRHPDFVFVGTGNTNLSGDAIYRDRRALDKATISRFVFLYWDYDTALEWSIVESINPDAKPWFDFVSKIREWARINNPAMYAYIHPRTSIDGAILLTDGDFTPAEAAEMTLFKASFDETARKAALAACPLPSISQFSVKKASKPEPFTTTGSVKVPANYSMADINKVLSNLNTSSV